MESDGSDLRRALIQLRVGELAAPALQIFARELQCVQNGAMDARKLRESSTQPRLLKSFLGHLRCPPCGNIREIECEQILRKAVARILSRKALDARPALS